MGIPGNDNDNEIVGNSENGSTGGMDSEITGDQEHEISRASDSPSHIDSINDSAPKPYFKNGNVSLKSDAKYEHVNQNQLTRLDDFEKRYRKDKHVKTMKEMGRDWVKNKCSKRCVKSTLYKNFPFLKIMRGYSLLRDLPSDVIAGFTVGIMQIPQGMAYAALATLPPICGLYTSLFAPLIYFFLGSSRHASMGTTAVVSLMFGSLLDSTFSGVGESLGNVTITSTQTGFSELDMRKIEIVTALTLVSGLIMMVLGKLGLGIVTTYMSEYLISGFTTAVGIHVITSQASILLGLRIGRFNGIFKAMKTWVEVFKYIHLTNWLPVVVSLVSMVVIYLVKVCVNLRFKEKLRIPIPIELMVVILATTVSYFCQFEEIFNLRIVGEIPAGIPTPRIPDVSLVTSLLGDAFIIGVIAFAQSVSMAKTLALKNHYTVDADQEMFAYGVGSVLCSFFSGYITSASVARSAIQDGAGGKTQVAALSSCCIVLVVVLAVGPLFYALPQCVLASIIIVNLRGILLQFLQLKPLWQKSRYDFWIWVVTFTAAVVLDTDIGLLIGIVFSVFSVVVRTQRSSFTKVGAVSDSLQYRSENLYDSVQKYANTVMMTFNSPIYFANAEMFKENCFKVTGINPMKLKKRNTLVVSSNEAKEKEETKEKEFNKTDVIVDDLDSEVAYNHVNDLDSRAAYNHVIIIMSNVSFIDTMGINAIKQVVTDFNSVDVQVSLVGFTESVLTILHSYGFVECMKENTFLTVSGALDTVHSKTL